METAKSYLDSTASAVEGLFNLLNKYGWHKMAAFVNITKSKNRDEIEGHKADFNSVDIAREVIAGSILQIAFMALDQYGGSQGKSDQVLEFESEINKLIHSSPQTARCKTFVLPEHFCVGRHIGLLPIGLIIFAARNQYNHHYDLRLSVVNEAIFNYLHQLWPEPPNGLSFNLYDSNQIYSYSVLSALGWVDTRESTNYSAYLRYMVVLLGVEQ